MAENPEVIVVGAGAAGLAAADLLGQAGVSTCVLEARARVGGRIFGVSGGSWPIPVELGAEFIHGGNRALDDILQEENLSTEPARGDMWLFDQGVWRKMPEFWATVGRVADAIPSAERGTFADFLATGGREFPEHERARVTEFVESFNAAPANKISAQQLHEDRAGADVEQKRPVGGYGRLVHALRRRLSLERVHVMLHAEVTEVRWEKGAVVVRVNADGDDVPPLHYAKAAIITLPLGLLRAEAVMFTPPLDARKMAAIAASGWGDVVRFTLRLSPEIWRDPIVPAALRGDGRAAFGFLNAPHEKIPVWWAPRADAPMLVGWVGGPAADRVMRESGTELLSDAVETLAHLWHAPADAVRGHILDWRWHNWRADVFARGAYSFPAAGAEDAPRELARPIEETLFFAGEATADASDLGTVHGALASGQRAAREVLAALGRASGAGRAGESGRTDATGRTERAAP